MQIPIISKNFAKNSNFVIFTQEYDFDRIIEQAYNMPLWL